MTDKYLTTKELMAYLKVGKSSIYRRINDGSLPRPIKLGNLQRFRLRDVDAALEALAKD